MGVHAASTRITSASGGLSFCRPLAKQDEGLVIHAHSNSVLSSGKTKANVVVAIRRIVVITVSRPAVPTVVDPRAAAQNTAIIHLTFTRHHFTQPRQDVVANYLAAILCYQCLE